ncbi:MAG: hypothetical protein GY705_16825 [Bacteroidetes bacterium]|nr:hypothetical protein [Bacteroidota bacterium]
MKTNTSKFFGKVSYALFFLLLLPALLILWSIGTEYAIDLTVPNAPVIGLLLIIAGFLVMLSGMYALHRYGKGLPMNAYPPCHFVEKGIYTFFSHPIYVGFCGLAIGLSIWFESATGLWIVSPLVILGCFALVLGYEKEDLQKRFPDNKFSPILSLPPNNYSKASWEQRIAVYILAFLPWVTINWSVAFLDDIEGSKELLVLIKENIFANLQSYYLLSWILSLVFVLFVPLLVSKSSHLRHFTIMSWIATGIIALFGWLKPDIGLYYLLPSFDTSFTNFSFLGIPLITIAALHFCCPILAGIVYARDRRKRKWIPLSMGIVLSLTNILSNPYPLEYFLSGILALLIAAEYRSFWKGINILAEKIANSWKEWQFGSVRIINHGFYVGTGAFMGILLCGWLLGKAQVWYVVLFGFIVVIFSALWAQLIEGSEKLKRPFGYYGALVGILFAAIITYFSGGEVWMIIGAISVGSPWIQAIGRLRCLINGCCHGKPIEKDTGIRYYHKRSRVCGISNLKGVKLHPTQVYSILWLFLIGFFLLKMWFSGSPVSFIFGMYLILSGIGRFVEEAYRGEPQTPILKGLRLYQWTAIASVFVGMMVSVIPIHQIPLNPEFGSDIWVAALTLGFFIFFVMGVDFPRSNARFSRLV